MKKGIVFLIVFLMILNDLFSSGVCETADFFLRLEKQQLQQLTYLQMAR